MKKMSLLILMCFLALMGCATNTSVNEEKNDPVSIMIIENDNSVNDVAEEVQEANEVDNVVLFDEITETENSLNDVAEVEVEEEKETIDDGRIKIKEKMFLAQIDDIYINFQDYLGKEIFYEGFMFYSKEEELNKTYYYVVRNGPGCCGNDTLIGFEIYWTGEIPEENEWVEVSGTLEEYEEDDMTYLRLNLRSIVVLEVRGSETIYQ